MEGELSLVPRGANEIDRGTTFHYYVLHSANQKRIGRIGGGGGGCAPGAPPMAGGG